MTEYKNYFQQKLIRLKQLLQDNELDLVDRKISVDTYILRAAFIEWRIRMVGRVLNELN